MDILDLFNGAGNPGNRKNTMISAPIELMSEVIPFIIHNLFRKHIKSQHKNNPSLY